MPRVTATEVKSILNTSVGDSDIIRHVGVANRLVDDLLLDRGMDTERLKDIEMYLAAHLVSIRDQGSGQVSREKVGESETEYDTSSTSGGAGLAITSHGRMAMLLDVSGVLSTLGRGRATFRVFGDQPT